MKSIDEKITAILEYFENEPITIAKNNNGITFVKCWLPSEDEPQLAIHGWGVGFEQALDRLYVEMENHKQANQ